MRVRKRFAGGVIVAVILAAIALTGCSGQSASGSSSSDAAAKKAALESTATPIKLTWAIGGGACEAPAYVAEDEGFFKKYGLDVELKQYAFDELKTGLATGQIAATVGNLEWIKPIEEGEDIRFIQGIHRGCIRGVAKAGLNINSPADLKGKRLGVNGIADYPDVLAETAIANAGLDPKKDVTIKSYPGTDLPLALKKGEIDAFIMWDPVPTQYLADNPGSTVWFDNMVTEPINGNYCCMLTASGKFLDAHPGVATKLSKAISEASLWVKTHPQETAKLEVEKNYVSGDENQIAERLASYGWDPSVSQGKKSTLALTQALSRLNLLDPGTDPTELTNRIYVNLAKNP